ncbi:MAG TPA: hypothetical protein VHT74_25580 [Acetobacteraceae bacterium]|jgi:hypothetical protein|nr:hypothetical protein [Acetobacteraceae bacterium]
MLAPIGLQPRRLAAITARLLADDRLFLVAGLDPKHAQPRTLTASPGSVAILLIAALTDSTVSLEWASTVMQHAHARATLGGDPTFCLDPVCALTGCQQFGRALALILARPVLADRVLRLELCRTAPVWSLWFRSKDGVQRTIFSSAPPGKELRLALDGLPMSASVNLPGRLISELSIKLAVSDG